MPVNYCWFVNELGGTADWIYSGEAEDFHSPEVSLLVDGETYLYRAQSFDETVWEVGTGAYTLATGTFARTAVLFNSDGDTAKIDFDDPPHVVIQDYVVSSGPLATEAYVDAADAALQAEIDALEAASALGTKNYILNSAMMVSQQNGATAGTASGYHPVDQFAMGFSNAGTQTVAQVSSVTPAGSPNRLRVTATANDASVAAGDFLSISQAIEGLRVADLMLGTASAKTVTISFGVKAPAGTYCVALLNAAANRNYIATYVISGGEANTDVRKSVTIALDQSGTWLATSGIGLIVVWALMVGSTFQGAASTWQAGNLFGTSGQFNFMGTNANVFELFDVSLTVGSAAPSFVVPDFASELSKCQRYWESSLSYGVTSAATLTGAVVEVANSGGAVVKDVRFRVQKRAAPTVVSYSANSGSANNAYDAGTGTDKAATSDNVGDTGYRMVTSGHTASSSVYWHYTANARL